MPSEADQFGGIVEPRHTATAVEVAADAHMLDTHHVNHMVEMIDSVEDVGF